MTLTFILILEISIKIHHETSQKIMSKRHFLCENNRSFIMSN